MTPSAHTISPLRRAIAGLVLLACLVQVLLFYVGLIQTTRRIAVLWGRGIEERRLLVGQPWSVFRSIAEQFPENAKIYLLYPEQHIHDVVNYYFYPRKISVSMTNAAYRIPEEYGVWAEVPDEQWLMSNQYTHVLSFTNGGRAWVVQPGVRRQIAEWERSNAHR